MSSSKSGPDLTPGVPLPADFFESEEEEPVSLFAVANIFIRHARLVLGLPALAFIVVVAISSLQTPYHVATSRFMTTQNEQFRQGGNSGGLLSQLGALVNESSGPSPRFFSALITSGSVVREVAQDTYTVVVEGDTVSGTVAELYGEGTSSYEGNVKRSERLIRSNLSAEEDRGTGFVSLSVAAEWPSLAVAVNRRLLEVVNEFNMEQRQDQAAIERQFVEEVLAEKQEDLMAAERELQRFLETNQQYEQSPRLRFEANRLERQVNMRQQMYTQLAQALEQARLSEVRNTPFIRVVEWPEENMSREGTQSPYFSGFLASVVAFLLVAGLVLAQAYLQRHSEEHSKDYAEFRRLVHEQFTSKAPRPMRRWVDRKAQPAGQEASGDGRGREPGQGPDRSAEPESESSRRELDTATRR